MIAIYITTGILTAAVIWMGFRLFNTRGDRPLQKLIYFMVLLACLSATITMGVSLQ